MTFNIWVGGSAGKQPVEQTTKVIRESKADIVGMQETMTGGQDTSKIIADSLGWHHFAKEAILRFLADIRLKAAALTNGAF